MVKGEIGTLIRILKQFLCQNRQRNFSRIKLADSVHLTCAVINEFQTLKSPGGNWLAINCGNSPNQNQRLEVVSKEGKRWVLQFKDFIRDGHAGLGGLYPEHWTGDGKYLYFKSTIGYSGGCLCFYR